MRFLDAGLGYASAGRSVQFATFNGSRYPVAKSYEISSMADCFESKISATAGKGESAKRCWTLDQVAFLNWRKDIILHRPALYAKLEIETDNRKNFTVTMTRTDSDGNTESYVPAMFRYAKNHPRYCKEGQYLTFSGKVNGEAEIGYFALPFGDLLVLDANTVLDEHALRTGNYTLGIQITAAEGSRVIVRSVSLCNQDKQVLFHKEINSTISGTTETYTLKA